MNFARAMDSAFERLKRYVACSRHEWGEPFETTWRTGRVVSHSWDVRCRLCGLRMGRHTREQLRTALDEWAERE